jgi:hypothetical protein
MREVTAIEPKWLTEGTSVLVPRLHRYLTDAEESFSLLVAPSFFKVADQNTISKRKKQERITPLFDKYVSLSIATIVEMGMLITSSFVKLVQVRYSSRRMATFKAQEVDKVLANIWLEAFIEYGMYLRRRRW